VWRLEWIDKSGECQSATVGDRAKLEEIMGNLEHSGVDPESFVVYYL